MTTRRLGRRTHSAGRLSSFGQLTTFAPSAPSATSSHRTHRSSEANGLEINFGRSKRNAGRERRQAEEEWRDEPVLPSSSSSAVAGAGGRKNGVVVFPRSKSQSPPGTVEREDQQLQPQRRQQPQQRFSAAAAAEDEIEGSTSNSASTVSSRMPVVTVGFNPVSLSPSDRPAVPTTASPAIAATQVQSYPSYNCPSKIPLDRNSYYPSPDPPPAIVQTPPTPLNAALRNPITSDDTQQQETESVASSDGPGFGKRATKSEHGSTPPPPPPGMPGMSRKNSQSSLRTVKVPGIHRFLGLTSSPNPSVSLSRESVTVTPSTEPQISAKTRLRQSTSDSVPSSSSDSHQNLQSLIAKQQAMPEQTQHIQQQQLQLQQSQQQILCARFLPESSKTSSYPAAEAEEITGSLYLVKTHAALRAFHNPFLDALMRSGVADEKTWFPSSASASNSPAGMTGPFANPVSPTFSEFLPFRARAGSDRETIGGKMKRVFSGVNLSSMGISMGSG